MESHKDLFSPLVCTTSTEHIFRKRRPSGTCMLMTSLWPSQPPHLGKRNLLYHTMSLLSTLTWLGGNSGSELRKLCAPSSTWTTNQPTISWTSIKTQSNSEVWLTSNISRHMLGSFSVVQYTLTHTQEESFVTSGTHQATGRCRLGSFFQSSNDLLLGTCICSCRVLCPNAVPQRSHKTHRCTFKRVDARYHWLPTKHTLLFLAHSIWHYPIWDKAQCFILETLHQSPQSETSSTRNSVPKTFS